VTARKRQKPQPATRCGTGWLVDPRDCWLREDRKYWSRLAGNAGRGIEIAALMRRGTEGGASREEIQRSLKGYPYA